MISYEISGPNSNICCSHMRSVEQQRALEVMYNYIAVMVYKALEGQ